MVNVELISDNLTIIMSELINNQKLMKYLNYNEKNPQGMPDLKLPASEMILSHLHPYPFDPIATTSETVEIRIYYPEGNFDGTGAVAETFVYLDIVCAKSLWLINDGKAAIRPYMIMNEIINHFHKNSISTLGRLKIQNFVHLHINESFDALRLEASVTLFGD